MNQTLYNLTFNDQYYVSTVHPDRLPKEDFSFVEIEYNNEIVTSIKGIYCYDDEQDSIILNDIEIMNYLKKIRKEECEIEFQGGDDVEDKNLKLFVILICSYLCYIHFMKWEVELSLDLLDREAMKQYLEVPTSNEIDNCWKQQVKYLNEKFSYVIASSKINEEKEDIIEKEEISEEKLVSELAKKYVKEYAKDYVRGYMKEYFAKKIEEITKEIKESEKDALVNINNEADSIAKEIKEFKRKLLRDVSKF